MLRTWFTDSDCRNDQHCKFRKIHLLIFDLNVSQWGGYLTLWGLTRKTIKTVPGVATGQQSIGKYNVALNGAVKCVQCFFVTVRAGTAYREI